AFDGALVRDPAAGKRINERWASIYNQRAWQRFLEHKSVDGLPDAEKAVALAPNNTSVLDTRGQIYLALARVDDAFADFDKAIRHGSYDVRTYFGRGRAHELKGNREAAIADYRKTLELRLIDDSERSVYAEARERLTALGAPAPSEVPVRK